MATITFWDGFYNILGWGEGGLGAAGRTITYWDGVAVRGGRNLPLPGSGREIRQLKAGDVALLAYPRDLTITSWDGGQRQPRGKPRISKERPTGSASHLREPLGYV